MSAARAPSSALTSFVVGSRYMPVYIALLLLVAVASIWAPATLSGVALRAVAPYGAVLGIAALGQMLVIMTGGIDLSVPGTMSLAAVITVGVGNGSNEQIWVAIATAVAAAAIVGLVNGILIGGLKLNGLIITLAVGLIVVGRVNRYGSTFPVQSPVPAGLSDWTSTRILGVSPIFWIGVGLTILLIVGLRYTAAGRRFQAVGANPVASHVVGVRVMVNQILVYVVAAIFYAIAGVALAGLIRTPGVAVGTQYLLGPIAAVVIGGASLTGGLASPLSTFAAALFLTGLNQMLRTMGLPTALQFVVFGAVIIGGMLVSGDRIVRAVEHLLRERRRSDASPEAVLAESPTDVPGRRRVCDGSTDPGSQGHRPREEEHETDQDHRRHRRDGIDRSGM
jgi:ribose transport system permease protein